MKKTAKAMVAIAVVAVASMFFVNNTVEAKRAKWYCYAPDPTEPWIQTCYSTTSRP